MKKIVLMGFVVVGLLLSGCAQKRVASPNNVTDSVGIDGDALSGEAIMIDETGMSEEGFGSYDDEGRVNSSSDGFKSVFFEFGKYNVSRDMSNTIQKNAENAKSKNGSVIIEGNCDSFGTDEYNHALGLKRASAVKGVLVSSGVKRSRIKLVSYGEANPICSENTRGCYSSNRRVDLKIK